MKVAEESVGLDEVDRLVQAAQELSLTHSIEGVRDVVRHAARALTGADGATFVLREGDQCYYVDEDAIAPLWKGCRFPMSTCISGWVMLNRVPAIIEDIYADNRIPADAYRPTFVKSLAAVPIRTAAPVGAIGNYWASHHHATPREVQLLHSLADLTSVALQNAQLWTEKEQRIEEARQAVGVRDEFISVASHELRTPLMPLKMNLAILTEATQRLDGDDDRKFFLERVSAASRSIDRLERLVGQLVDVSRIMAGRFDLEFETVDLGLVVRDVVEDLGPSINRTNTELAVELAADLVGRWDHMALEQIVSNLLANALKYGAGEPVSIVASRDRGNATLQVQDCGIGIKPDDQERIFKRFERAAPTRHYGGMGMGLFVVRNLVEAHGGAVAVDSTPGEGSTFTVTLPLTTSKDAGNGRGR